MLPYFLPFGVQDFFYTSDVQWVGGKINPTCISNSVAPMKRIPTAIAMFFYLHAIPVWLGWNIHAEGTSATKAHQCLFDADVWWYVYNAWHFSAKLSNSSRLAASLSVACLSCRVPLSSKHAQLRNSRKRCNGMQALSTGRPSVSDHIPFKDSPFEHITPVMISRLLVLACRSLVDNTRLKLLFD